MLHLRLTTLTALLLCAGCNHDAGSPADGKRPAPPKSQAAPGKAGGGEDRTAGMVTAVTLGKSTVPVDLKFALEGRPALGQPLAIKLALLPKIGADLLSLKLADSEGFEFPEGGSGFDMPEVVPGGAYVDSTTVTPTRTGLSVLTLELSIKHDDIVEARVFSVPIFVPVAATGAAAPRAEPTVSAPAPK
jgi:hypothetical protein